MKNNSHLLVGDAKKTDRSTEVESFILDIFVFQFTVHRSLPKSGGDD